MNQMPFYTQPGGFAGPVQSVFVVCVVVFVVWGVASAFVAPAVAVRSAAMQSAPARCRMCLRVFVAMMLSLWFGVDCSLFAGLVFQLGGVAGLLSITLFSVVNGLVGCVVGWGWWPAVSVSGCGRVCPAAEGLRLAAVGSGLPPQGESRRPVRCVRFGFAAPGRSWFGFAVRGRSGGLEFDHGYGG